MTTTALAIQDNDGVLIPTEDAQYLTFMLNREVFSIGILNIKEIIEYGHVNPVPMMPKFIRGVINLRGRVVPVIDLSERFGRQSTAVGKRTSIVIIETMVAGELQDIGVVVDVVLEVLTIAAADIKPPPSFGANIRTDFISCMGKVKGEFVIILNVENVLSTEELSMLSSAAQETVH